MEPKLYTVSIHIIGRVESIVARGPVTAAACAVKMHRESLCSGYPHNVWVKDAEGNRREFTALFTDWAKETVSLEG